MTIPEDEIKSQKETKGARLGGSGPSAQKRDGRIGVFLDAFADPGSRFFAEPWMENSWSSTKSQGCTICAANGEIASKLNCCVPAVR